MNKVIGFKVKNLEIFMLLYLREKEFFVFLVIKFKDILCKFDFGFKFL